MVGYVISMWVRWTCYWSGGCGAVYQNGSLLGMANSKPPLASKVDKHIVRSYFLNQKELDVLKTAALSLPLKLAVAVTEGASEK
jgi:hypothetical protein